MTSSPPDVNSDLELLALARSILDHEGYAIEEVPGDAYLLLAENAYFVIGVVATATIGQLITAEGPAEATIRTRLAESDPGPKSWDAYLMLLTQERSLENSTTTRDLFEINYDTTGLRRIAHVGVDATLSAVREALTPFVVPIELDDPTIGRDPFDSLVEAVAARGIDRGLATRAVTAFQKGVPLGDVL